MRESFIFHQDYIQDIPEELQPQYAMYTINYALKGIEPEFTDWRDIKCWNKIKDRIDSECIAYEETKNARSEAGKKHSGNQYTRKWNKMEQMEQSSKPTEQNGTNGTVSVSDSVSVNDPVYGDVNWAGFLSPSEEAYAKEIFNVLVENNLPCYNKDFDSFKMGEFRSAMETLHGKYRGIHSKDFIQAIKNYAFVVNSPQTWYGWKNKKTLAKFVSWEHFTDFLPNSFVLGNFQNHSDTKETQGIGKEDALRIAQEMGIT